MECFNFKELNMFAMKQPRKLSNQESQRFENFRIQAPKSKGRLPTVGSTSRVSIRD